MGQLDGDNGGISEIRSVSSNLRKYEATLGITTPHTIDETRPQDLSTYLSKRLAEEEAKSTEGIEPETVRKILTRLKSQTKQIGKKVACPCCTREFASEPEIVAFQNQMKFLLAAHSPLLKLDERNKSARLNYKQWQQIVANNINDIFEYQRITNEVDEIGVQSDVIDEVDGVDEANEVGDDDNTADTICGCRCGRAASNVMVQLPRGGSNACVSPEEASNLITDTGATCFDDCCKCSCGRNNENVLINLSNREYCVNVMSAYLQVIQGGVGDCVESCFD